MIHAQSRMYLSTTASGHKNGIRSFLCFAPLLASIPLYKMEFSLLSKDIHSYDMKLGSLALCEMI